MPEPPPDFEQLAERLVDRIWSAAAATPGIAAPDVVVDALRHVWTARGAADQVEIEGLKARVAELEAILDEVPPGT